jgi:hypothetical protein
MVASDLRTDLDAQRRRLQSLCRNRNGISAAAEVSADKQ